MKLSPMIDLGRSLRQVFGNNADFEVQIEQDNARQSDTARAILRRLFGANERERRELTILADEVGLGKTYVALAVAVSILDAIRCNEGPDDLPSNKPVVLVLTPANDALFNKWMREAEAFKRDCARSDGGLDWLQIRSPIEIAGKSGNVIDLSSQIRGATRSEPMLLIAKQSVFGAALHDRDLWRRRSLAALFKYFRVPVEARRYWCRRGKLFDNFGIPDLEELLDLRRSRPLWDDPISPDLERAFERALGDNPNFTNFCIEVLNGTNEQTLSNILDQLARFALASDWPQFPLVVFDEIHGLKNEHVQSRQKFETLGKGRVCRMLGLSATPFQLRHDELLSLLKLRRVLALPAERAAALDRAAANLAVSMKAARDSGEVFRRRWMVLRPVDQRGVEDSWGALMKAETADRRVLASQVRPPRIAYALTAALDLERKNAELQLDLHPFVIRHQHVRGHREHFVGNRATLSGGQGSPAFCWSPGMEARGSNELVQYLMMRAVALAKEERGMPSLGAELTGSYRHLLETAAVWKKLSQSENPLLHTYRNVLERMIGERRKDYDPDAKHTKVQATVQRAFEFFKRGQKSLIFCVHTKTAETIRDQLQLAIAANLGEIRDGVFGDEAALENFRRRFFNRREALFSLIQDHPLLGKLRGGRVGIKQQVALGVEHLRQIASLLLEQGDNSDLEKPDRRLLIAAVEHVAVKWWSTYPEGRQWVKDVLRNCPELEEKIASPRWLEAREPLSRSERAAKARRASDPEAIGHANDPLEAEEFYADTEGKAGSGPTDEALNSWVRRLREDAIGEIVAPYFRSGLIAASDRRPPLLAMHHHELLAEFDLETRAVAGQVFRRILMAEEFLLRYLADVEKEQTERWADYLSERYDKPLAGHLESLRNRVNAYLETLVRAKCNRALLSGYHAGAENRNVVQLVKGDTQNRDRYFLGFNTPYRPEILVSTSVGQEGIDLHRECRHVIHHDLSWNPAMIEQRTGRVDRIGSKVQRERMGVLNGMGPTLEIAVPYLAATYDERMFEELYRRAQLFEVTLGGELRVEGRIEADRIAAEQKRREELGIGTDDEDLGEDGEETGVVDLPHDMIQRLRVDLSVWKPPVA